MFIRSNHPHAYKSGEWGKVIGRGLFKDRQVYIVKWPDWNVDLWPVADNDAKYEFDNRE
jgi:hypothetical protein